MEQPLKIRGEMQGFALTPRYNSSRRVDLLQRGSWTLLFLCTAILNTGCRPNAGSAPGANDVETLTQTDQGDRLNLVLGAPGDLELASWPNRGPWYPPFEIRGRRTPGGSVWTWRYEPEGEKLPESQVHETIEAMTDQWARTGVVQFREAEDGVEPDFVISWRRGRHDDCSPFLGWDGGVAHATDPSWKGTGFIHLNADLDWTVAQDPVRSNEKSHSPQGVALRRPQIVQLSTVLLHELGHLLGLGHGKAPLSVMSALYPGGDNPPKLAQITAADAAGVHSLYGGGRRADSDLWICSVDDQGVPHPVAPALRRVAPLRITAWDVADVDGDGRDEIIVWPTSSDPEKVSPLGSGLSVYHFGESALLEEAQGPAIGLISPEHSLEILPGKTDAEGFRIPGILGQRVKERPLRPLRFSSEGLPLLPWDQSEIPSEGWRVGADPGPRPLRDIDRDGAVDLIQVLATNESGLKDFGFEAEGQRPKVASFQARVAFPADLDGDGILELVVQGLR